MSSGVAFVGDRFDVETKMILENGQDIAPGIVEPGVTLGDQDIAIRALREDLRARWGEPIPGSACPASPGRRGRSW